MELINTFDIQALLAIHAQTKNAVFDAIMPVITHLGETGLIWIVISFILLANKKYRYTGFLCLCSLAFSGLVGELFLKHVIQRPRPFSTFEGIELLVRAPRTFSFPSGHTMASFAAAYVLSQKLKPYGAYFFLFAAVIAFSRLYLLVHYPLDVLAGALLGILCAKCVLAWLPKRIPHKIPLAQMDKVSFLKIPRSFYEGYAAQSRRCDHAFDRPSKWPL